MARPKKGKELEASERVALRITAGQRRRLDDMASRRQRSISDEIREAIDGHIARDNYGETAKRRRK